MPEDLEVPAVGKVKREYVLAGVALTVGIVGAVWYRNRAGGSAAPAIDPAELVGADREPMDPGAGSGSVDSTDPTTPRNNAEWSQMATEYLSNFGWEPALVTTALGKYLGRQRLSTSEADAVRSAVGAFGPPPDGGPYSILLDLPTPAPGAAGPIKITLTEKPGTVSKGREVEFRGKVTQDGKGVHKFVQIKHRNSTSKPWMLYPATVYSKSNGEFVFRLKVNSDKYLAFQIPYDAGAPGTPTVYAKVNVK